MSSIEQIDPKDKRFIVDAVRRFFPDAKIIAFGSRIKGTAKKYSDLDLTVDVKGQSIAAGKFLSLEEFFAESDLPFKVDLSDYASLSEDFK